MKPVFLQLWRVLGLLYGRLCGEERIEDRLCASLAEDKKEEFLLNLVLGRALRVPIVLVGVFHLT